MQRRKPGAAVRLTVAAGLPVDGIRATAWRVPCVVLLLATAALLLFHLGSAPLFGPDEPRYSQVAREMADRGDLVTPTIDGQLWAEKPPLVYWGMVLAIGVFGVSEWSLRLPSVIAGLIAVYAVCAAGRRARGARFGLLAGAVLATSIGFWSFAHGATMDMSLTAWVAVGLGQLLPGLVAGRLTTGRLVGAAAAFGLAILAKGLIGLLLPILIVGAYLVAMRPTVRVRWSSAILAGLVLLAMVSTWFVPVVARHGWGFIETFFISHHFDRYLNHDFNHPGPPWYYLVVVLVAALPWTPFLIQALARLVRSAWQQGRAVAGVDVFLALWVAVPVVFFSLSQSKLPGYVLPALPGAALVVASALDRALAAGRWRSLAPSAAIAALVAGGLCLAVPIAFDLSVQARPLVLLGFAGMAIAGAAVALVGRGVRGTLAATGIVAMLGLGLLKSYLPELAPHFSNAHVAQAIARDLSPGERVLGYHWFDHSITFYTNARSLYGDDGNVVILRTPEALLIEVDDGAELVVTRPENAADLLADRRFDAHVLREWDGVELLRVQRHAAN